MKKSLSRSGVSILTILTALVLFSTAMVFSLRLGINYFRNASQIKTESKNLSQTEFNLQLLANKFRITTGRKLPDIYLDPYPSATDLVEDEYYPMVNVLNVAQNQSFSFVPTVIDKQHFQLDVSRLFSLRDINEVEKKSSNGFIKEALNGWVATGDVSALSQEDYVAFVNQPETHWPSNNEDKTLKNLDVSQVTFLKALPDNAYPEFASQLVVGVKRAGKNSLTIARIKLERPPSPHCQIGLSPSQTLPIVPGARVKFQVTTDSLAKRVSVSPDSKVTFTDATIKRNQSIRDLGTFVATSDEVELEVPASPLPGSSLNQGVKWTVFAAVSGIGSGDVDTCSADIEVSITPPPICQLISSQPHVLPGASTILTLSCQNPVASATLRGPNGTDISVPMVLRPNCQVTANPSNPRVGQSTTISFDCLGQVTATQIYPPPVRGQAAPINISYYNGHSVGSFTYLYSRYRTLSFAISGVNSLPVRGDISLSLGSSVNPTTQLENTLSSSGSVPYTRQTTQSSETVTAFITGPGGRTQSQTVLGIGCRFNDPQYQETVNVFGGGFIFKSGYPVSYNYTIPNWPTCGSLSQTLTYTWGGRSPCAQGKICMFLRSHIAPCEGMGHPVGGQINVTFSPSDSPACTMESSALFRTEGCFTSDTKILMSDGKEKTITEIHAGDSVWSAGSNSTKKVLKVVQGPEPKPLYEVTTAWHKVVVTDGHPFLTQRGWLKTVELKKGDVLLGDGEKNVLRNVKKLPYKKPVPVWNIQLTGVDDKEHVIVANGIPTGDLFIQGVLKSQSARTHTP